MYPRANTTDSHIPKFQSNEFYMDKAPEISVVVTLYNEEDNVRPLLDAIHNALTNITFEVVLVDDGSSDATVERILAYDSPSVKLLRFWKNYGQTAAMSAGIDNADGRYIVTMDGDLQNDPTDIPAMLLKVKNEGWDVVAGYRKNRKDGMLLRKVPSKLANKLIRWLTGVKIHDYGCTLKVFDKDIAKGLGLYGELHRFIPVLAKLEGAKITEMDVKHHPRIHGESKYGLGRTIKVMSDLLLMLFFQKYFQRPIHFFGPLGFFFLFTGGAVSTYLLVLKILGEDVWGRPLLLVGITFLLAGIQFITFGLISELMMRTYFESQKKKTYRIKDIFIGKERKD